VHVSQEGLTGQYISDSDIIRAGPYFEDRLLDALAIIRPSSQRTLDRAFKELKVVGGGVIIAVMGRLSQTEARQLAACRTEGSQGIALLLDVAAWADPKRPSPASAIDVAGAITAEAQPGARDDSKPSAPGQPGASQPTEAASVAAILRAAGWHVTTLDPDTSLSMAWQRLPRAAEMLVATGTSLYPGTGNGVRA